MKLYLVRHGQSESNVIRSMDTSIPGPRLTGLGHRQAHRLATTFKGRAVDGIAISTMVRTRQTAAPLAAARRLPLLVVPGLEEVSVGVLQGRLDQAAEDDYFAVLNAWASGDLGRRMPGASNGHEFLERYDRAIAQVYDRGWETGVVVTHSGAMRAWVSLRCTSLPPGWAKTHPIHNTDVLELTGRPGQWRIKRWQDEVMDTTIDLSEARHEGLEAAG